MKRRAITSPFLSYIIDGRLFLGLASSSILGRSSESFTTYHATPALSAPVARSTTNSTVIIRSFRMETPFFFLRGFSVFFFCLGCDGLGDGCGLVCGLGLCWLMNNISSGSMRKFLPCPFGGRCELFPFMQIVFSFQSLDGSNHITHAQRFGLFRPCACARCPTYSAG